jgi:hypothetical protein
MRRSAGETSAPASPARATRGDVLARAAVGAGALIGGGTIAAAASLRGSKAGDARVLNFVLLLDQIEAAFYRAALEAGRLTGELREFADVVGGQERQHVAFLETALGSAARKPPRLRFGDAVQRSARFIATAVVLEDLAVAAYNGQTANLTPGGLAAAARIVSVEARHAAWIRDIAGQPPAAKPVDASLTQAEVLAAVKRTGFLRGG